MPEAWSGARLISQNVYRLRAGRFGVRVDEVLPTGTKKTRRFAFHDRAAAEAFRDRWFEARQYVRAGLTPRELPELERRRTVREVLDAYLEELKAMGRSEAQQEVVERVIGLVCGRTLKSGQFVPGALGNGRPVPLSREDLVQIAKHVTASTNSGGYATRRAFTVLRTAHLRAQLDFPTPPSVIAKSRGRLILPRPRLLAFLDAMPLGSLERTIAEVILRTGCREAEALRLRRGDVDMVAGILRVGVSKGGPRLEERPISSGLAKVLKPYLATLPHIAPPELRLFTLEGHELKDSQGLRWRLKVASKAAGLERAVGGFGWLRNQTATLAVESGESIEVARRALGHRSSKTTEKHYDKAVMWDARRAFAAAIDGELEGDASSTPAEKDPGTEGT